MKENNTGGKARKFVTRVLAAGALLAVYTTSMVAVTGGMMAASVTSADAQWRGRGWRGRGRGWRGRGWRGRGRYVCHHRHWNSRRVCWWR
jgi:hypothetical protein